jgi:hypothetical protein
MDSKFSGFELDELRVLQRVFREAKFCLAHDDTEIIDSPRVAVLFDSLMSELIAKDALNNGEKVKHEWLEWLDMDDERRAEYKAAAIHVQNHAPWRTYSESERREYLKVVFCPFVLSDELTKQIIMQAHVFHHLSNQ